ncbi:MAG: NAD-dependent epimerase/dehydratase family protein [Candidatus Aureabacteria bacterium]|nr:NAD-dependent epimerase/dehydratase family protein [Candidatus Auribacterota bacterium]
MKVLITGAAGFIGSHLAEDLASNGHSVRCLYREGDDTSFLSPLGCELIKGDLNDAASLKKAVDGMERVYHLAALSRYDASLPDEVYYKINAKATEDLLELSINSGVDTFVYISSIEGRGLSTDGKPLTEKSPSNPRNIYGKTKYEGEVICREYAKKNKIKVKIVITPTTYGPREYLIMQRIFRPVSKGFFVLFGKGDALIEFCYIKNQIMGMKLIADNGISGESYIISDERSYQFKEVIKEMAKCMNKKIFLLKIPYVVAWLMAVFFEAASKIFKFYPFFVKETGRPPISRPTLQWAAKSAIFCDISKARDELGYVPIYSLAEGMKETIDWYRENGYL